MCVHDAQEVHAPLAADLLELFIGQWWKASENVVAEPCGRASANRVASLDTVISRCCSASQSRSHVTQDFAAVHRLVVGL